MSSTVWISTAMGHASNQRPFRNDSGEIDKDHLIEVEKLIETGEPLASIDFPTEIFGAPNAKETAYRLPDLWHGFGYWVVSARAANVLRTFDLGKGDLFPVKVLKKDRQTSVGGEWFCINFGSRKRTLVPESSRTIRQRAQGRYRAIGMLSDNDIVVSQSL